MTTHPVDPTKLTMGQMPAADLDRLIAATIPASSRDCDLMAEVPLPPGADSAGPWQLYDDGRPYRTTNTGVVQYANGMSHRSATLPGMTTHPVGTLAAVNEHRVYDHNEMNAILGRARDLLREAHANVMLCAGVNRLAGDEALDLLGVCDSLRRASENLRDVAGGRGLGRGEFAALLAAER